MTDRKCLFTFAVLALFAATTVTADEIYKRVDKDGNVEYSDRPSPDAESVEVNPNVVETTPVQRSQRSRSRGEDQAAPRSDSRSETRSEAPDEPQAQDDVVADEDPGRARRNAVRGIAQPQPRPQPR